MSESLKNYVPLAVFRADQVPEAYKERLIAEGFVVDPTCLLEGEEGVGESFIAVPLLGRVQEMNGGETYGVSVSRMDTLTAAALASTGPGWIGEAKVEGNFQDQTVRDVVVKRVAENVTVERIIPYCTDSGPDHNNTGESLTTHILQGRNARETFDPKSHKRPLKKAVLFERGSLLIPHCGSTPLPEGLEVAYDLKRTHGRIILSLPVLGK